MEGRSVDECFILFCFLGSTSSILISLCLGCHSYSVFSFLSLCSFASHPLESHFLFFFPVFVDAWFLTLGLFFLSSFLFFPLFLVLLPFFWSFSFFLCRSSELEATISRLQQEKSSMSEQIHHLQQQNTDLVSQITHLLTLQQQQPGGTSSASGFNALALIHQQQPSASMTTNEIPDDPWASSSFVNAVATALVAGTSQLVLDLDSQFAAPNSNNSHHHVGSGQQPSVAASAGGGGAVPGEEEMGAPSPPHPQVPSSTSSSSSSSSCGDTGPGVAQSHAFHLTFQEASAVVDKLLVFKYVTTLSLSFQTFSFSFRSFFVALIQLIDPLDSFFISLRSFFLRFLYFFSFVVCFLFLSVFFQEHLGSSSEQSSSSCLSSCFRSSLPHSTSSSGTKSAASRRIQDAGHIARSWRNENSAQSTKTAACGHHTTIWNSEIIVAITGWSVPPPDFLVSCCLASLVSAFSSFLLASCGLFSASSCSLHLDCLSFGILPVLLGWFSLSAFSLCFVDFRHRPFSCHDIRFLLFPSSTTPSDNGSSSVPLLLPAPSPLLPSSPSSLALVPATASTTLSPSFRSGPGSLQPSFTMQVCRHGFLVLFLVFLFFFCFAFFCVPVISTFPFWSDTHLLCSWSHSSLLLSVLLSILFSSLCFFFFSASFIPSASTCVLGAHAFWPWTHSDFITKRIRQLSWGSPCKWKNVSWTVNESRNECVIGQYGMREIQGWIFILGRKMFLTAKSIWFSSKRSGYITIEKFGLVSFRVCCLWVCWYVVRVCLLHSLLTERERANYNQFHSFCCLFLNCNWMQESSDFVFQMLWSLMKKKKKESFIDPSIHFHSPLLLLFPSLPFSLVFSSCSSWFQSFFLSVFVRLSCICSSLPISTSRIRNRHLLSTKRKFCFLLSILFLFFLLFFSSFSSSLPSFLLFSFSFFAF